MAQGARQSFLCQEVECVANGRAGEKKNGEQEIIGEQPGSTMFAPTVTMDKIIPW